MPAQARSQISQSPRSKRLQHKATAGHKACGRHAQTRRRSRNPMAGFALTRTSTRNVDSYGSYAELECPECAECVNMFMLGFSTGRPKPSKPPKKAPSTMRTHAHTPDEGTHTDKQTSQNTDTTMHTPEHTNKNKQTKTSKQTNKQTNTQTNIQTKAPLNKEGNKETEVQFRKKDITKKLTNQKRENVCNKQKARSKQQKAIREIHRKTGSQEDEQKTTQ